MNGKTIYDWNHPKIDKLKLSNKEQTLMNSLLIFYSSSSCFDEILPIILGCSNISLRILDWFATNYSKKTNVSYDIKKDDKTNQFNVYKSYKAQLKAYSKKLFDPFCRGDPKVPFQYDEENCVNTTIGQLNFFRWAISNNILQFVKDNLNDIDDDMNKNKNINMNGKKKKKIVKSSELILDDFITSSASVTITTTTTSSESSTSITPIKKKMSKEIVVTFG